MARPTFEQFKIEALKNSEVKKEYDELANEFNQFEETFNLRKQLIKLRKEAGLSQEKLAELLDTKKSNISRLENVNSKISPKLSTLEAYAEAVGYKIKISFERNV